MTRRKTAEDEHLLREADKIAGAIGKMFPGLCEVVVHDLTDPQHAIRTIENNMSGRKVGDSVTEFGLARINDPDYPSVIQNYPNQLPDGRSAKSTSIGIKNSEGRYIAAICLNLDVSLLSVLSHVFANLVATEATNDRETLRNRSLEEITAAIDQFAAERMGTPRGLRPEEKRRLVKQLHRQGYFARRHSVQLIGNSLGISRASVYNYSK